MKPCSFKRRSILTLSLIAAVLTVVGFQNCARPEFSFDIASRSSVLGLKSSQALTCAEENLFSVDITINDYEKFYCLDETKLSESVTEGAICEAGPVVKAFQVMSEVPQDCERTTMCGVAPLSSEKRYENGKIVYTLKYKNLPLGCEGKVKVVKTESLLVESEQQVNVQIPSCNYCQFDAKYTCGYCKIPKSCTTPWGGVLAHGASVNGAASGVVPYNQECSFQQLSCNDGVLSGDIATYKFGSCIKQTPKGCSTPWGDVLAHGGSIAAAKSSSVPFGQTCAYQNVSCTDGLLSENSSVYKYKSCTVQGAANCTTPWGGSLGHGSSVDAFTTSSVSFGQSCSSQKISCSNGTLSANSASYRYSNCSVKPPANCTTPWGSTLAHGASVTAAASATVAYNQTCSYQSISCNNGVLSANAATYKVPSCTVSSPRSCTTPWGATLAHGGSVNAASSPSVAFGHTCQYQSITCSDGTLSSNATGYRYPSCTVLAPVGCYSNSQYYAHGTSRYTNIPVSSTSLEGGGFTLTCTHPLQRARYHYANLLDLRNQFNDTTNSVCEIALDGGGTTGIGVLCFSPQPPPCSAVMDNSFATICNNGVWK